MAWAGLFTLQLAALSIALLGSGAAAFSPASTVLRTSFSPTVQLRACPRRSAGGQRGQLSMAEAGLYSPFWEHTASVLKGMGGAVSSYPIPDGFAYKETAVKVEEAKAKEGAQAGPDLPSVATTQTFAYQTSKLRQIRCAYVNGGDALQFAILPHLNYDIPFFGLDLVSVPSGHLIAMDMPPLSPSEEYRAKHYGEEVMAVHAKHVPNLPWFADLDAEIRPYFSPAFIWTRPSDPLVVSTHGLEAFKEYLALYFKLVEAAEPVTDPVRLEEIRERQLAYFKYRSARDPCRWMTTRMHGAEWTDEYFQSFLFDLEAHLDAGAYKAGEVLAGGGPLTFDL